MKPLAKQLEEYRQQHTTATNKLFHYIGIPAIVIGALLLLNWVWVSFAGHWNITFAWIAVIGLLIYYYFLDIKLAVVMTVALVVLNLICYWIAYPRPTTANLIVFLILFIGGWILQFIGHSFEKTKPSFTANISQVFIAPMFVVAEFIVLLGLGQYFNLEEKVSSKPDDPEDK